MIIFFCAFFCGAMCGLKIAILLKGTLLHGCFLIFQIVQMVPTRAMHLIFFRIQLIWRNTLTGQNNCTFSPNLPSISGQNDLRTADSLPRPNVFKGATKWNYNRKVFLCPPRVRHENKRKHNHHFKTAIFQDKFTLWDLKLNVLIWSSLL